MDHCQYRETGKVPELINLIANVASQGDPAIEELATFLTKAMKKKVTGDQIRKAYIKKDGAPKKQPGKLHNHPAGFVAKKIDAYCKELMGGGAGAGSGAAGGEAGDSDSDDDEPKPPPRTKAKRVSKATPVTATSIEVFRDWDKNMIIEWMLNNMPEEDLRACIEHAKVATGTSATVSATTTVSGGATQEEPSETKGGRTGISQEECYSGIYVWGEDRTDYAVYFWDFDEAKREPGDDDHWYGPYTVPKRSLNDVAERYCTYMMAIDDAPVSRKPKQRRDFIVTSKEAARREKYNAKNPKRQRPKETAGQRRVLWQKEKEVSEGKWEGDVFGVEGDPKATEFYQDWETTEFDKQYDENCYYKSRDWPNCKEASGFGRSFVGAQGTVGPINVGDNFWGVNPAPNVPYGETLDYQEPNFCGLYNQIPVVRDYSGPTGGRCKFGKRKKTAKRKTTNTPTASAKSLPVRTIRTGRDGKRYIVVIRASGKGWKKVDRSRASKGGRKSPTISASTQRVGTKKRGNDGNMWVIKTARSSTGRRYRVWRRL